MGKIIDEKIVISELMQDVKNGKYNIPRFQRNFVWEKRKIINLLDSLEKNFPIGVLLLANSDGTALSGRNEVIDAVAKEYKKNGFVVVDGQQRLTSISIIYYASDLIEDIKRKKINNKTAKVVSSVITGITFYENEFFELDELAEKIQEAEGKNSMASLVEAKKYLISIPEINKLVQQKIGNKNIFTHTLKDWADKEIIEIFTAMNRKVDPLTHIDLMNGSMFNVSDENFDLLDKIKKSNQRWSNWGIIKQDLFVQLMKIYSDLVIEQKFRVKYKAEDLVLWSGEEGMVKPFIDRYLQFEDLIVKTNSVLDRKLDIYSMAFLPKDVYYLTVFSLLCLVEERDEEFNDLFQKVISHVSKRLIDGAYASSPNAKAMEDINKFVVKIAQRLSPDEDIIPAEGWEEKLKLQLKQLEYKNKSQALFKICLSVLAENDPLNLFIPGKVPVKPTESTKFDVNIHHFIPTKSSFEDKYKFGDALNGIGNLALISEDENKNTIRAKDIHDYLALSKSKLGTNYVKAIDSHLFDNEILEKILIADGENSIQIHNLVRELFQDRLNVIFEKVKERFFK